MNGLQQIFYSLILWAVRFELAVAMNAPERNRNHIAALQRDIGEYERVLIRLELLNDNN